MKIVGHDVGANDVELIFDDGYSLIVNGRKQCALYSGDFEIFGGVKLCHGRKVVARYTPEDTNPKMKLASGWSRESFMARWDEAAEYFENQLSSIASKCRERGAMSTQDLHFLQAKCHGSRKWALDGRHTKVGSL